MRNFETTVIQCHVRRIVVFFFYFVIFSQRGGQETVHAVAKKKGAVPFLAFLMVWETMV